MAVNITPLHDRVLVRRLEEKETVKGGIIIPDNAKEKYVCYDTMPDPLKRVVKAYIDVDVANKELDEAIKVLDLLFDKYPDVPAIARACKSVAIKLDEATNEMIKAKADQAKINENLRRISRYYAKWLNLAPALNMRITMADVLSVAVDRGA